MVVQRPFGHVAPAPARAPPEGGLLGRGLCGHDRFNVRDEGSKPVRCSDGKLSHCWFHSFDKIIVKMAAFVGPAIERATVGNRLLAIGNRVERGQCSTAIAPESAEDCLLPPAGTTLPALARLLSQEPRRVERISCFMGQSLLVVDSGTPTGVERSRLERGLATQRPPQSR